MKRSLLVPIAVLVALGAVSLAGAQAPAQVPFPAEKSDVAVFAYTVATADSAIGPAGSLLNYFKPGSTVRFLAYAADAKTGKVLTATDVKSFYVQIPGQPKTKLTYGDVGGSAMWSATWFVPDGYPAGVVEFKVLVKTKTNRYGSFVQVPVVASMLTITK